MIPGAACRDRWTNRCDRAMMTYDSVTDRIVVVEHHTEMRTVAGTSTEYGVVRVADKPAAAKAFGPVGEIAATPTSRYRMLPMSVTSRGGQITVALRRLPPFGRTPHSGALYVMTGDSPASVGQLARVPSSGVRDLGPENDYMAPPVTGFIVTAVSRNQVIVAWQRDRVGEPSWDSRRQGIWTRRRVRDPKTGVWRFRPGRHVTTSAYDVLDSLAVDRHGAAVVGFHR